MSTEENELLNKVVAVSGFSKQEYCYRKCMDMAVTVSGNPKVYKALKYQMQQILEELKRIGSGGNADSELLEVTRFVARVMGGMKEEGTNHDSGLTAN